MSTTTVPEADPALEARGPELRDQPQRRLFRVVWRWHFYAGLLVIPVVVLMCLSGIVYLFKPQIDGLVYGDLRSVTPSASGRTASFDDQRAAAERRLGEDGAVVGMAPPVARDRATEFDGTNADGRDVTVYVDPYNARVTGVRDDTRSLSGIALDLHGNLLTARFMDAEGKWGDRLIELVASWAIVLVLTGLYLWWPRKRSLRSALTIRRPAKGRRVFWRDLHAVVGVLGSFVFLFFLVTGMSWTGVWGAKTQEIATNNAFSYPPGTFDGAESKVIDDVAQGGKAAWAMGQLPLLRSTGGGSLRWDPQEGAPLDAIVGQAEKLGFPAGYTVAFPEDESGSYTVTAMPDGDAQPNMSALDERVTYLDQYTAQPISDFEYAEFGAYAKTMDLGIALHEGRQFGTFNQILTLTATLALLLMMASAIVMWRKRRPRGIGAPRREVGRRLGTGVVVITLALGILFPLLGLSILAILLIDFLVVRRIPSLRRALGATG